MSLFAWGDHGASEQELAVAKEHHERKQTEAATLARQNTAASESPRTRQQDELQTLLHADAKWKQSQRKVPAQTPVAEVQGLKCPEQDKKQHYWLQKRRHPWVS